MALTAAERAKRYRDVHKCVTEQRHVTNGVTATVTEVIPKQQDPYAMLPTLPVDQLITANAGIAWSDVLQLSRLVIDEVYHVAAVMDDDIMLRLVRAAGYCKRTAKQVQTLLEVELSGLHSDLDGLVGL